MTEVRYFQFDEASTNLELVPLCARRVLDHVGAKLSLDGWRSLSRADRADLCQLGSGSVVATEKAAPILQRANPPPKQVEPTGDPSGEVVPEQVLSRVQVGFPLTNEIWAKLEPIERYALFKVAQSKNLDAFPRAYTQLVRGPLQLTHLDRDGHANMVSTSTKPITLRRAVAESSLRLSHEAHRCLVEGNAPKGDVLSTARIAGIMAAKQTHLLIPLCHPIVLTRVDIRFEISSEEPFVRIVVEAEAMDRTGVEMEALTGASVAALTVYDMLKAVDRTIVIGPTLLLAKSGGRSGDYHR